MTTETMEEGKQNLELQPTEQTVSSSDPPKLDPPLTSGEKMRDALLRTLDSIFFQYLGIAVLM